ncbi:MAG: peptide ABC transporter ATP-binding protein [Prevotellaceae bacterium]|nr:MAG: peptide ABC transporter ATP-binding protein [Prevotellaceae bacterium]
MGSLIEVKHLKKYFKTASGQLHAVDDVSFSIPEGQTLGVVGESGCGKSTLGRVVLGLLDSTDGEIYFDGENITNVSTEEFHTLRQKMQIIFQDPYSSLNPRMSVGDIIAEPLQIFGLYPDKIEREEKVKELMRVVGLDQRFINSYPHELDGGRRQRIGIARALSLDPKFIVCDEPVSALDVSIQAQILNLMQDLQEQHGLTYMFITHNLAVVKHISDTIMVMYLGQMVELCSGKELFSNNLHPYTKALLSAIPRPSIRQKQQRILLKGELSSPIDPKPGCRFAVRCNYATPACFERDPELREYCPGHFVACHNVEAANN